MLEKIVEKVSFIDALIILIAAFATVSFWRGVWGLMDIYLLPENQILSLIISVVIGVVILFLISIYHGKRKRRK